MDQSANKLALVEPSNFSFNTETFETNIFQNDVQFNKLKIFEEFDSLISSLDKNNISFNLHKPQLSENIGACARAIKNFNFKKLVLINPKPIFPNDKILATSVG